MIIDFRVRAPFSPYAQSPLFTCLKLVEKDTLCRVDACSPQSAREFSMQLLLNEAKETGIDKLVVPVRRLLGDGNVALVALISSYPDRIIGLAGIKVEDIPAAITEIEKYVVTGPCKGIVLEPGQDANPWRADSDQLFPLYSFCESANVPIAFTYGGIMCKGLRFYDPLAIDAVAEAFPKLKIALCHGGWPYVTEVCQIALNRGNVWLAPDIYMVRSPGMGDYIMAANHLLRNRVLFASAYPILPLREAVKAYEDELLPAVIPMVMGGNALEFLNL